MLVVILEESIRRRTHGIVEIAFGSPLVESKQIRDLLESCSVRFVSVKDDSGLGLEIEDDSPSRN